MRDSLRPYVGDRFLQSIPVTYTAVDELEIRQALSEECNRSLICEQYGLPVDRILVFSLGQLIHRKGYLVLLDSIRRLREINPKLFFVWIGDGYLRPEIEDRIRSENLHNSVRVIPPKEIGPVRSDLIRLLGIADLFVHPSFSEGLPIALLEAMALGKACIASRVNAIPEAVTDGVSGVLVNPGDDIGFANAIAALAEDSDRRSALGNEGQAIVFSRFTEAIAARVMVVRYDSCVNAH
jgi:glycosyltransferase involved in cell wall biosynthesis